VRVRLVQYKTELVNRVIVDALCELHKQMGEKLKGKSQVEQAAQDVRLLTDAINTLEALRRNDNAANLFEQLCSPSRSEDTRKLTEQYTKGDFAKRAILRYLFRDSEFASEEEMERIMSGDKEAQRAAKRTDAEIEQVWTLAIMGIILTIALGGGYMIFFSS